MGGWDGNKCNDGSDWMWIGISAVFVLVPLYAQKGHESIWQWLYGSGPQKLVYLDDSCNLGLHHSGSTHGCIRNLLTSPQNGRNAPLGAFLFYIFIK